ncbi:hypothetical protein [Gallibacterium anatis]|uniref:hypothetical protein n=1 Tax=Gallibacterium anatis TaxID=750 RepID=UPI00266FCA76|nr:hypothetical protein [Gallibacterium anatis]WKS98343.1 hypothetical protein NYR19_06130 [Gallibacterium anatis]
MNIVNFLTGLFVALAFVFALVIAYTVAEADVINLTLDKNSDYHDELTSEQLEWKQWADAEWKAEHGNLQTPLTAEHEAEIRRGLGG